ncbi:MAG: hypothetical protein AAF492_31475, partial [Verrucomicrobiota bacterium]
MGVATLGGQLNHAAPATVTVYWGSTDGGIIPLAWENAVTMGGVNGYGTVAATLSNLLYGVQYYYRTYATNIYGEDWADASIPFTTAPPGSPWEAGLLAGTLAGDINLVDPNPATTNVLGPHAAADRDAPLWADNTTWVYGGQVFLNGQTAFFAENIDDRAHLVIDGTQYLNDSSWNTPTGSGPIDKPAGWYNFELRMSNGGGGSGPVAGNGWSNTKGFGMAYNIAEQSPPQGGDYFFPQDNGKMNLFRHLSTNATSMVELGIRNGEAGRI